MTEWTTADWPVLTERLVIRPVELGDRDAYLGWRAIPGVVKYMYQDPWTGEVADAKLAAWASAPFTKPGENLNCAVALRGDPMRLIGETTLKWSAGEGQAELGYAFHPDAQGHGYATEAARATLALAFGRFGFHRVFARIDAENAASRAIAERLGMRLEATLIENDLRPADGVWATEVDYAILAREFAG